MREKVSIADEGIYIGEWLVGSTVRQGRGTMIYEDGSTYEGYWQNNAFSGKGRYIDIFGGYYTGNWKNGLKDGHGV